MGTGFTKQRIVQSVFCFVSRTMSNDIPVDAIAQAVAALLLPELQKLTTQTPRPLLNEAEAETLYGFGRGTFRYWRNRNPDLAPPGVKVGKRWKYRPADLDTWAVPTLKETQRGARS